MRSADVREQIDVADVYFVSAPLEPHERQRIEALLVDPLLQTGSGSCRDGVAVETTPLPGVTDPGGRALDERSPSARDRAEGRRSGRRYEIAGPGRLGSHDLATSCCRTR
jgi:hypothetical protein